MTQNCEYRPVPRPFGTPEFEDFQEDLDFDNFDLP